MSKPFSSENCLEFLDSILLKMVGEHFLSFRPYD